jgi:Glycosyltransferase family 87
MGMLHDTIASIPQLKVSETTAISARSYKTIGRFFVLAILATHVFFLWSVRDRIARGDPDFTVFYTAGRILRQGRGAQLYDAHTQQAVQREFTDNPEIRRGPLPFIHPPFEALVFLPLTFFSYRVAFVVWGLLNIGMLFGVWLLLRSSLACLLQISSLEFVLLALSFFPIFATFHQGQDAILLLLVVVLGFRALNRSSEFVAGCWLGFGVFKYHLILPLVLILVIWKGRKLALGFVASASSLVLISLALVGWHAALQYPAYALHVVSTPGSGGIPLRQIPNLLGLLGGWPVLQNAGWPLQGMVLACCAGLVFYVAGLRDLAKDRRFFNLCLACAVISALLAGYSTNTYDLSLLVLPLALVADHCLQEAPGQRRAKFAIVLPVVPLLVSPLWFYLWMRWERINLIAAFLVWWVFAIRAEVLRSRANAERVTPLPLS